MSTITSNLLQLKEALPGHVTLVAVSKTRPIEDLMEAYHAGQRVFGENRVQELVSKYEAMPKDIQWHLIGHLQKNKVKYIAPFVSLIHSADSTDLLREINKEAEKHNRTIDCLLQIYIAQENSKFGFSFKEVKTLLESGHFQYFKNIRIVGLMGMATNTDNMQQVCSEFSILKAFYEEIKLKTSCNTQLSILSMGMSNDYQAAIAEGSTMVRIGSSIFDHR